VSCIIKVNITFALKMIQFLLKADIRESTALQFRHMLWEKWR